MKQSGFKLAMDDVGSAYSGLRIISMIEPDFIKLDMELTREARHNRVKMELLKAIAGFSTDAGIPMIVEGIETEEELDTVARLGVQLVQGYLMGRPAAIPAKKRPSRPWRRHDRRRPRALRREEQPSGWLVSPAETCQIASIHSRARWGPGP